VSLTHLILLRHGETDWNAELRMQGHRDVPLNAVGTAQALAAAPSVAALAPDVIVSSDLRRAAVTARAVGEALGSRSPSTAGCARPRWASGRG
jgi:broad specificity phosphatase PhoE